MNPLVIVAAIAVVGGSLGIGFKMGHDYADGKCSGKLYNEAMTATKVLNIKDGELEQCRGQIDKFNLAVSDQERQISAFRREQNEARQEAVESARVRDAEIAASQIRVQAALNKLKGQLDELELSPCAGAVVDGDLIELLNAEFRAASDRGAGRDSNMSTRPD